MIAVLEDSRRLGFLGDRPIDEVIAHARSFVDALVPVTGRVADLGSGGGVPGLVIALDRPDLEVVLVDRRAKRTDFLSRVVRRLGWADRVRVRAEDVAQTIEREAGSFDAVVARGFGPPDLTLARGVELVRSGGLVVISEPPVGDRWSADQLRELGVSRLNDAPSTVAVFRRDGFT